MMNALLVAAIAAVLAGLGAIAYGIPVKEFSFGNTIIVSGTVTLCTGLILFGLSAVLAELKLVSHRLRLQVPADTGATLPLPEDMPGAELDRPVAPPMDELLEGGRSPRGRLRLPNSRSARLDPEPEPELEPEPEPKPKRNLLFSSNLRRDRERSEEGEAARPPSGFRPAPLDDPSADEPAPPAAPSFGDSWSSRAERGRSREPVAPPPPPPLSPLPRRPLRAAAPAVEPPPLRSEPPEVSVIKSGVVDGMAYSLYSDGSIEAQLPEGMMRFASIAELRDHLDQRA